MASALRSSILRHFRVQLPEPLNLNGSRLFAFRSMSSHGDDHLDKQEVVDRVLDVVKTFPKVDPSKAYEGGALVQGIYLNRGCAEIGFGARVFFVHAEVLAVELPDVTWMMIRDERKGK
ncbi:acyl carrier protein [Striga asiatica]|uniref:Acyl carrier protein n=1 Tax=Striga asiatica TaxID=4170 RepID=A0A5A7QXW5_STRAF|nr:acyl carrier protein [Striga asiatica]